MGIIRLLDDKVINKIAAGEVIEKPASIVKELVENSIDAGATEITVEIKGGGISLIRVTDNGKGLDSDDMGTAFLRHATSKIWDDSDLYTISTLGFRGEALASIAAVAKVEMISKLKTNSLGNIICLEGGKILEKEESGSLDGTIITVRDLFFNTPARLKFLKTESREAIQITDTMQNLAMSHSKISFKYKNNDKLIFATKGDGDLKSVILSIYGREIFNNIIEVDSAKEFISVKGYLGNSEISKASRNYQSVFINGRYIKNKTITAAVEAAYKSMLTINKFPMFVLHLYINPEFIDVNVHPAKSEVKFQDDQLVFKAVYHSVKDALVSISPMTAVDTSKNTMFISELPKINYVQDEMKLEGIRESINPARPMDSANTSLNYREQFLAQEELEQHNNSYVNKTLFNNEAAGAVISENLSNSLKKGIGVYEPTSNPIERGSNVTQTEANLVETKLANNDTQPNSLERNTFASEAQAGPIERSTAATAMQKIQANPTERREGNATTQYNSMERRISTTQAEYNPSGKRIYIEDKQTSPVYTPISRGIPKFEPLAIVGQIHFTYIVAESMEDMYLIDQHAAHERIYYENFMAEYKASSIQSQNLLVPIVIELSLSNKQQVFDNMELFSKIGYEIDDFGGNSIALRCVPLIYGNPDNIELFNEILSSLETKTKDMFHVIDKVIYTMACKSAIKAGDKLNYREMTELIEKLRYCENPFNCPHGRPTIIKMSYVEMEKKFKRIQ